MLDNTGTGNGTLGTKGGWDGDREGELVCWGGVGVVGEVIVGDQWESDDGVGSSLNDGDIGSTSVGCAQIEFERDDLSRGVGLNVGSVILQLESLAQPNVAGLRVIVGLSIGNLEFSLDVSVGVGVLVVVNLITASSSLLGGED